MNRGEHGGGTHNGKSRTHDTRRTVRCGGKSLSGRTLPEFTKAAAG